MNYQFSSSCETHQRDITPDQLNQITHAILDGRYSWACVLMLRFIGYNPLHYIPQRTYSRLIKENNEILLAQASMQTCVKSSRRRNSSQDFSKMDSLEYLETADSRKLPTLEQEFKQMALRS